MTPPPDRRKDGEDGFIELTPRPDPAERTPEFGTPAVGGGFDSTLADRVSLTPVPFAPPPPEPAPPALRPLPRAAGRWLVLLLPAGVLLAGVAAYLASAPAPAPPPAPAGKLVVLLAFDFLPADTLDRWAGLFGPDGFERLKATGVWFPDAAVPQAFAAAGPGFAGLVTGVPPRGHGVTDDTPAEPLVPTVGDALKAAGAGKVVAVGLDARVRALAGRSADVAVAFDATAGEFRPLAGAESGWLEAFNAGRPADRWPGTAWEPLLPAHVYDTLVGPDRPAGKGGGTQGVRFPHPFGPAGDWSTLLSSPAGDELTWEAAKAAAAGERLGRRGDTDLLLVGLTAGGRVMRAWGPDGHEAADLLVRADRLVSDAMAFLDTTVGPGRWAVVVAGCHGGCPLPEWGRVGGRFDPAAEFARLGEALDEAFGRPDGQPGRWVERFDYPWLTLDRRTLARQRVNPADTAGFAAQWLANRPAVAAAYARGGPFGDDPLSKAVAAGFHPDRGGDVFVVGRPFWVPAADGSAAGSPHPYDRAVALLAAGAGVPRLGTRPGAVSTLVAAPLLAKLLGVPPPAGAAEPLPAGME